MKKFLSFVRSLFADFHKDHPGDESAVLSFYLILSFPALLFLILGFGHLFLTDMYPTRTITSLIGSSGESVVLLLRETGPNLSNFKGETFFTILILCVSASGVLHAFRKTLQRMWHITPRRYKGIEKTKQFIFNKVGVLLLLILCTVVFLATTVIDLIVFSEVEIIARLIPFSHGWIKGTSIGTSSLLLTSIFFILYKWLPHVRIASRDCVIGALITAFLFTTGKFFIGLYLGHTSFEGWYGTMGSGIIFMLWIYYSSFVILLGAKFTYFFAIHYGSGVHPDHTTVSTTSWKFRLRQFFYWR